MREPSSPAPITGFKANLDLDESFGFSAFDNLDVSQASWNAEADVGHAALGSLSSRLIRNAEKLGNQRGIAVLAISEEDQVMRVSQPCYRVCIEAAYQFFIPTALLVGENQLAFWIHHFCFPGGHFFALTKAMAFIGFQRLNSYVLDTIVMK